ncbi:copper chaperone PCu(A)C [Cryptosporangium arvum]|uniref:copper chaperone PCu(A)C n=1 Tax=Cryptosporangium arvum TaxID=80871 RepID=UPI0004AF70D9|nr:copper chaperone PCu(A)C [Cryptosporangium arvum]
MSSRTRRASVLPALGLTLALLAAGCGSDSPATTAAAEKPAAPASSSAAATAISITDPWIKAADKGMTAAFGTLVNNTDKPLTIVGASSDVSAMELHEMTMKDGKMIMRPKEGGFVLPAKGRHELSPGGDHLMFMALTAPVKAGDEVAFTLKLADGGTVPFTAVAKPYSGAEESYAPDGGMDMHE